MDGKAAAAACCWAFGRLVDFRHQLPSLWCLQHLDSLPGTWDTSHIRYQLHHCTGSGAPAPSSSGPMTLTKHPPMKQSALCIGRSVQMGFGLACGAQSGAHGMRWSMTAWSARLSWKLVVGESAWLFVVWWVGWFVKSFTTPQRMCFGNGLWTAWVGSKKLFSVLKKPSSEQDVISFVAALMDAGMEWWAHRQTSLTCFLTRDGSSSAHALCSIASTRPRFAHCHSGKRHSLFSILSTKDDSFHRSCLEGTALSCALDQQASLGGRLHWRRCAFWHRNHGSPATIWRTCSWWWRHSSCSPVIILFQVESGESWSLGKDSWQFFSRAAWWKELWAHAQGGRAVGRAIAEVSQSLRTPQQPKPCQDHQRSWKARVASATCSPTSLLSMWSCETCRLIFRKGATGGNDLAPQGLVHCLGWHWRVDYDGAKTEVEVHDGDWWRHQV